MRKYKGKDIELLAPAGNYETLISLVDTGCDAIYFGGQSFNMRLMRKGYNFSNEELIKSVELLHEKDKRAYITVNNLINESELDELDKYLTFLDAKVHPDALIVQDFAVINRIKELDLSLTVHASVMMNVHNLATIKTLQSIGVPRVVLSREASLDTVSRIKEAIDIEIEYFTHGDMCIAHGAQCYYSSVVFGMSGNQGKCMKPCRWKYDDAYPLAVKDISLYNHIGTAIKAGVTSFKIEGRMRPAPFITKLIEAYSTAFDSFLNVSEEEQESLQSTTGPKEGADWIQDNRGRDLSSGYAFGRPGKKNINSRNEGVGKIFSTPHHESSLDSPNAKSLTHEWTSLISKKAERPKTFPKPKISLYCQTMEQAMTGIDFGVDRIYLANEVFPPQKNFGLNDFETLREAIQKSQKSIDFFMSTPQMSTDPIALDDYHRILSHTELFDGVLIHHLGDMTILKNKGLSLAGDLSMNIMNHQAMAFYKECETFTPSIELKAQDLLDLINADKRIEPIIYGYIPVMYFEHDFHEAKNLSFDPASNQPLTMHNEGGDYHFYRNQYGRYQLLSQLPLNLLPLVPALCSHGLEGLRIQATIEDGHTLRHFLNNLANVLDSPESVTDYYDSLDPSAYTYGSLIF